MKTDRMLAATKSKDKERQQNAHVLKADRAVATRRTMNDNRADVLKPDSAVGTRGRGTTTERGRL